MTETMIGHQSLVHVAELAGLLRAHWNDRERVPLSSQLLEIAQVLDEVPKLTAENERLKAALTPSAATKAAYIGEFHFHVEDTDKYGEECQREITVPWSTVKEIMAAISKHAALEHSHDA